MATFLTVPPDDWFTPPGTLRVSEAAIELAREFRAQARQAAPDEDWVISFDWGGTRRVREKGTNRWRDLGPGIDLTAYERWKIRDEHIEKIGDLAIAMKIPHVVWEKSVERLIDVDETAFSGLILR